MMFWCQVPLRECYWDYHPHVHLVVPAAALNAGKKRWHRKRRGKHGTYLFNAKALATVFRAKLLAALAAAGLSLPRACPPQCPTRLQSLRQ